MKSVKPKVIVIDAAHGGQDSGSVYNDIIEKDIVLDVSKYLVGMNSQEVKFIPLRTDDSYIPLNERLLKIDSINPDMVISLHIRLDANEEEMGVEAFVVENTFYEKSKHLASDILNSLTQEFIQTNKEISTSDEYLVTKVNKSPCVLLELGNISNENDRELLNNKEEQKDIATAIYKAVK
ncbi:hypothetical protein Y10_21480 [Neptunitalea sp. Y10]|uniref:N-acetylmuramoyl-L-alanine amidase n=2 Tax=Neptunitalea lumnitzerae TaxID=2965509 RepID=A0ABQ5MK46_9FLAO|nr:hypothetical protein Y10_21480 [Neptunitalea sp. Y10]